MDATELPIDEHHQRADVRRLETALRHGYPISDEMRAAIAGKMAQLLVGQDGRGNAVTTNSRTQIAAARVLAMLDRINLEREKMGDPKGLIRIPITPEQLAEMSDEELDALEGNLGRIVSGKE